MNYVKDGAAIYRESFSIIRREADLSAFQTDLARVVVRMIHACGMTDLPQDVQASPGAASAGVNALHFGIIMAVNLSIGLYMPPFGLNLFAARAIFNVPMGMIYRGVLPFIAVNFIALMVITYVPAISMALIGTAH